MTRKVFTRWCVFFFALLAPVIATCSTSSDRPAQLPAKAYRVRFGEDCVTLPAWVRRARITGHVRGGEKAAPPLFLREYVFFPEEGRRVYRYLGHNNVTNEEETVYTNEECASLCRTNTFAFRDTNGNVVEREVRIIDAAGNEVERARYDSDGKCYQRKRVWYDTRCRVLSNVVLNGRGVLVGRRVCRYDEAGLREDVRYVRAHHVASRRVYTYREEGGIASIALYRGRAKDPYAIARYTYERGVPHIYRRITPDGKVLREQRLTGTSKNRNSQRKERFFSCVLPAKRDFVKSLQTFHSELLEVPLRSSVTRQSIESGNAVRKPDRRARLRDG